MTMAIRTVDQDEAPVARCPFAHGPAGTHAVMAPVAVETHQRDELILGFIDRWEAEPSPDGLDLARFITVHVREVGKHFLSAIVLERLSEVRRVHGRRDRFFDAFLDTVLDKHEGRYYNRTYIALALLEVICDVGDVDPLALSDALMADVVGHETDAAARDDNDALDAAVLRKRITHAQRLIATARGSDVDALPRLAGRAREWFDLTVLPVYVAHDEYFFIRALQAHEMVYTVLTASIRAATTALRSGSLDDAVAHLDHGNTVFARSAGLFRLVATMRAEQFHAFRDYTQGASAIQSEAYKRFEVACGRPTDERLSAEAFTSVPVVRAEAFEPHDDLSQAYLDARRAGSFTSAGWDAIDARLGELEASHQRWKITHHSLANRMLGDATGSGYTSGVPYLRTCLENRLFFRLAGYLGLAA
jgi:tryptophan 2,3-dioxygenase